MAMAPSAQQRRAKRLFEHLWASSSLTPAPCCTASGILPRRNSGVPAASPVIRLVASVLLEVFTLLTVMGTDA
jgi:hypothetical protein